MAEALGIPTTNYSRRKDAEEFPSFEELARVAGHFGLSALALQVAFGYLDADMVVMDDEGAKQYIEQGGGDIPPQLHRRGVLVKAGAPPRSGIRPRRADAPSGP